MHPLADRPRYTREQLATYVRKVNRDEAYTLDTLEAEIKADPLPALAGLQRKQVEWNPWGNLALHYSWHRTLSLDSEALYDKIVDRGLGGYCMENNAFFSAILRSLGYELYITGARVSNAVDGLDASDQDGFGGWQHEVLIVTVNGQKYLVDVGFGSHSPLQPILLRDGETVAGAPGREQRLVKRNIAPNTDPTQKLWVIETRSTATTTTTASPWRAGYCFTELEWLPEDFAIINYRTSHDPQSWFTHKLVLAKALLDEKQEMPIGSLVLVGGEITRRVHGQPKETVASCRTEKERVEALKTWFGIELNPDEQRGILGTAAELREPMAEP